MKTNILRPIIKLLTKNSSEIKIGLGIGGFIGGAVLGVTGTIRACKKIEETKQEMEVEELTKKETVKLVWRCYIPSASVIFMAMVLTISGIHDNRKRTVAMASALAASDATLLSYKDKVEKILGREKREEVDRAVTQAKVAPNQEQVPTGVLKEVIISDHTKQPCIDPYSNQRFEASVEDIRSAINRLNHEMMSGIHGYVSFNEYYDELDLEHTSSGYDMGWNIEKGLIEARFEPIFDTDGRVRIAVDFVTPPTYDYIFH